MSTAVARASQLVTEARFTYCICLCYADRVTRLDATVAQQLGYILNSGLKLAPAICGATPGADDSWGISVTF